MASRSIPWTPIDGSWAQEREAFDSFTRRPKRAITGNENVGARLQGAGDNPLIVAIRDSERVRYFGCWLDVIPAKQGDGAIDDRRRGTDLFSKHPAKLVDNDLGGDELMFRQHDPHDICTEATGSERADEHVRVEEHLQEMSSKTSSSVR